MKSAGRRWAFPVGAMALGCLAFSGCQDPRVAPLEQRVGELEKSVEELEDCCDGDPGRGPIIVLEPTTGGGGTLSTVWKLEGAEIKTWGNAGQLRDDLFGAVEIFGVKGASGGEKAAKSFKLTLTDGGGSPHTLEVERSTTGQFSWKLDTSALVACDYSAGNGVPDCTSSGVPAAFNGTINAVAAEVLEADGSTGTLSSGISQVRMQASW